MINKEEWFEIAWRATLIGDECWHDLQDGFEEIPGFFAFINAILERAAVECLNTDTVEASGGMSYYAQLGDASATRDAIAEAIRALKTQGD